MHPPTSQNYTPAIFWWKQNHRSYPAVQGKLEKQNTGLFPGDCGGAVVANDWCITKWPEIHGYEMAWLRNDHVRIVKILKIIVTETVTETISICGDVQDGKQNGIYTNKPFHIVKIGRLPAFWSLFTLYSTTTMTSLENPLAASTWPWYFFTNVYLF